MRRGAAPVRREAGGWRVLRVGCRCVVGYGVAKGTGVGAPEARLVAGQASGRAGNEGLTRTDRDGTLETWGVREMRRGARTRRRGVLGHTPRAGAQYCAEVC